MCNSVGKTLLRFISLNILINNCVSSFNPNERKIMTDLIKEMEIKHCIIVSTSESNTIFGGRNSILKNLPTSRFNYNQLLEFLISTKVIYVNIVVVFEDKNFLKIRKIFDDLKNVKQVKCCYFSY